MTEGVNADFQGHGRPINRMQELIVYREAETAVSGSVALSITRGGGEHMVRFTLEGWQRLGQKAMCLGRGVEQKRR